MRRRLRGGIETGQAHVPEGGCLWIIDKARAKMEDIHKKKTIETRTLCSSSSSFYWHSKDKIVALHTAP